GLDSIVLDLRRVSQDADVTLVARAAFREGRLRSAAVVAGPIEVLLEHGGARAVQTFAETAWPIALTGSASWDADWSRDPPLLLSAAPPPLAQRSALWRAALNGDGR